MIIKAQLKHLRIPPRKVRLITDLVKGLGVKEAEKQLEFSVKRAVRPIIKLLNSAVANAEHNHQLDRENLFISNVLVSPGPVLKRWMPRARGAVSQILKRTSHVTLILETRAPEIPVVQKEKIKEEKREVKTKLGPDAAEPVERTELEDDKSSKTRPVPPPKPYPTSSQSKKRFFSRQTFGNAKKFFRRKSM